MMYPFMVLDDNAKISHSDMLANGSVKVYIEKQDGAGCRHALYTLPSCTWAENAGFSEQELLRYDEVIRSTAEIISEFSQCGGFRGASDLPD